MGTGARITQKIKHKELLEKDKNYREAYKKKNKTTYWNEKNKLNNKCKNGCDILLAPRNKSGLCRSCSLKEQWKQRKEKGGTFGFIHIDK